MISQNEIFSPIHPGEILKEEFLDAMDVSSYRLAKDTGMTSSRVGQIVNGQRSISADTAIRLSGFFNNSAEFWLGLQMQYDLECAQDRFDSKIKSEAAQA